MNTRLYWRFAAALMIVAGLVSGLFGHKDWGMGAMWIAIGAMFLAIGEAAARRSKPTAKPDGEG